ncbi:hypothetical protein [Palaeococcus ferrophilus]|uniref:hypothetical protein n=1 Tax=Palaeococcus ferrophilus TaxID=83868 RepID=UPI0012F93B69|nr:hypothetical protein [Palaeococcus ferrophilus]
MAEATRGKALKLYERMFEREMEILKLIEEKKREIKPGMLGKGSFEEFKKYKLEVYEG